jgi:hypothetical protein
MIGKLVEVLVTISQKNSPMHATIVTTSFQIKLVVTTTKEPKPIGGAKLPLFLALCLCPHNM